jgi:hypothetical protein
VDKVITDRSINPNEENADTTAREVNVGEVIIY